MIKAQSEVITTVLIILLVMAGVFIVYDAVNTPEYNITQTTCWNETHDVKYTLDTDFHKTSCPDTITDIPCYDSKGNEIKGLTCFKHSVMFENNHYMCFAFNNQSSLNSSILVLNYEQGYNGVRMKFMMWEDNAFSPQFSYDYPDFLPVKGTHTEQKCEPKEVENLNYGKYAEVLNWIQVASLTQSCGHNDFDYCVNLTCNGLGGELIDYQCFVSKQYSISKSDLTEDWMNENCDVVLCEGQYVRISEDIEKCIKGRMWKCGENYEVTKT